MRSMGGYVPEGVGPAEQVPIRVPSVVAAVASLAGVRRHAGAKMRDGIGS